MIALFCLVLLFEDTSSTYVGEFMELGVGARALGMGNAFVGLANDPTAFYWNPAGLAKIERPELFLMHSEDFDGIVVNNTIACVYPMKSYNLSIALYWLGVPNMEITDSTESGITVKEIVNIADYVVYLSYARAFHNFDFGVNIKGIFRDWGTLATAYGIGTDIGILTKFKGLTLGVNLVNATGTEIFWSDNSLRDWIPPLLKAGVSLTHEITPGHLMNFGLGFDTSIESRVAEFTPLHTDTYLGFEYWYQDKFAFRVGRESKGRGVFCAGCGVIYRTLKLDYALKFDPELGLVKRLSGSLIF